MLGHNQVLRAQLVRGDDLPIIIEALECYRQIMIDTLDHVEDKRENVYIQGKCTEVLHRLNQQEVAR
jgi:hypothetical protein